MAQCSEMPMNHQRKQYNDNERYIGFTSALENIVIPHINKLLQNIHIRV